MTLITVFIGMLVLSVVAIILLIWLGCRLVFPPIPQPDGYGRRTAWLGALVLILMIVIAALMYWMVAL
ncbi:hypothetical protein [Bifidobacterium vespertilionis]|uniref:Uncharacterized protein n=1 Tax=Bifidobacterium vespertilionis TaxID=2562524 RepID=A0A5J5DTU1_9BIFI|nr:hypothetical protein [Bifidobacterium vespertilionis]KAA8818649.1 hypothetical protein EMO90_09790 [Bifidobacterium vespertilionis]KAA8823104.1 hypothetical protein EM848_07075 [Bifidobacterium vespertilionis]